MQKRYPKEVTCQCCGKQFLTVHYYKAKYCGNECARKSHPGRKPRHGLSGTPEHDAWLYMRHRCRHAEAHNYALYGGRGIKVCDRWDSFEDFLADMGPRPGKGYSIERLDNNGNYEPDNCKWATALEQSRNRRGVSTPEQDQIIRDGLALGLGLDAIAAQLGKTPTSVQNRAYRIGLNFGGRGGSRASRASLAMSQHQGN